jgi:hypothetical protein
MRGLLKRRFTLPVFVIATMVLAAPVGAVASGNHGQRPPAPAANAAPVLSHTKHTISWAKDPGATDFKGAISTGPRGTSNRTTVYTDLSLATSWTPAAPACGRTLYYGVASQGPAGERWTAHEVFIAGPACAPSPPGNLTLPTISGTAAFQQTLNLSPGKWSRATSQTETWEECGVSGPLVCTPRADTAPGDTLALSDYADVYQRVAVLETATGPGGVTSVLSAPTVSVAPPAPIIYRPPVVNGAAVQGQTLTLSVGQWRWGTATSELWEDCTDSSASHCTPVATQPSGTSYVLGASDVGSWIVVIETATGPSGTSTTASQQPLGPVARS